MKDWRILPMGEAAVLAECALADVAAANTYAHALANALAATFEVLPAIRSVLIRFDPLHQTTTQVIAAIEAQIARLGAPEPPEGRVVTIPVGYDGPDLEEASHALGLSMDDLIRQHTAQPWRVLMIGFAPGFPYIGPLPPALSLPRRATPRPAVPAGSVAIAAGFTGIYPARLPGGWHLIGQTDVVLFDPQRTPPALLSAGDRVQFVACCA
jgi:inhibitor of KinA